MEKITKYLGTVCYRGENIHVKTTVIPIISNKHIYIENIVIERGGSVATSRIRRKFEYDPTNDRVCYMSSSHLAYTTYRTLTYIRIFRLDAYTGWFSQTDVQPQLFQVSSDELGIDWVIKESDLSKAITALGMMSPDLPVVFTTHLPISEIYPIPEFAGIRTIGIIV